MIAQLRSENKLAPHSYRELYLKIKGNTFRSRAHLNSYLEEKGLVKKVK
jgi:ribosomal protein L19E